MNQKEIVNTIADKVVPISENKRTFRFPYFYGYAKGGYDVDPTRATWFIDPNLVEPGSELEKMLTYNIAFSAEVVLLMRNYLYKHSKAAPEKINGFIQVLFDATSCAAVRCANKMLYPIQLPKRKPKDVKPKEKMHWYHKPGTNEISMFRENEVPEGWERGRGKEWNEKNLSHQSVDEEIEQMTEQIEKCKQMIESQINQV